MLPILLQAAGMAPSDCALYGFCAEVIQPRTIPSGAMYLALGMVLSAAWLWRRQRATRKVASELPLDP